MGFTVGLERCVVKKNILPLPGIEPRMLLFSSKDVTDSTADRAEDLVSGLSMKESSKYGVT